MEDIKNRILTILGIKRYTPNKLSGGQSGSSLQKRLNNQLNGDASVTTDCILLVLNTFPDVSAEWLMRGTGDMFMGGEDKSVKIDTMSGGQVQVGGKGNRQTMSGNTDALLAEKDKQIEELKKDKEFLTNLVTNLTQK